MNEPSSEFDPVDDLAEEFLKRYRGGERPSLSEYAGKYPELAERIRAVFPALVAMEEAGHGAGQAIGPHADPCGSGTLTPERLGDYLLLRRVGAGGMGIVYEAIQESLGRHVALKTLPFHHLSDSTRLERFRREARAAARLHHTHIVPVFGVGEHEGLHYYTMQFIRGHGLDAVLREVKRRRRDPSPSTATEAQDGNVSSVILASCLHTGRFPANLAEPEEGGSLATADSPANQSPAAVPPTTSPSSSGDRSELSDQPETQYLRSVARIGVQVAEALEYAHRQGILHRDIKPSNLLLDADGEVWVTDFGLAKAQDSDDLTRTGDIVGTLRYMAPERFNGWSDPRSDVYALGATLYELLTLQAPFDGTDRVRLVERVLHESPVSLRQLDRRIPRDLETIVLKALAKEPGERYATAGQMAEDLQRFLTDRSILARRLTTTERTWRWCRRNPVVAALLALVGCLLIAGTVASSLAAVRFKGLAFRESAAKSDLSQALGREQAATRAAQHNAEALERQGYISLVALSLRENQADNISLAEQSLERCPPHLRGWEWRYCNWRNHRELRTIRYDPGSRYSSRGVCLSPDGQRMVCIGRESFLVCNLDGTEICTMQGHDDDLGAAAWSRDGKTIAVCGKDSLIRLWDSDTGAEKGVLRGHVSQVNSLCFSPDDTRLASAAGSSPGAPRPLPEVKLWDIAARREIRSFQGILGRSAQHVTFSADGKLLVAADTSWAARLWEVGSGKKLKDFEGGHSDAVNAVAFSPDGRRLATASEDALVVVWDVSSGAQVRTLSGHTGAVYSPTFLPDGRRLATSSEDSTIRVWDFENGRLLLNLHGHHGGTGLIGFDRTGARLISGGADGMIKLWDATVESDPPVLFGHTGWCYGIAFHPGGKIIATCGWGGILTWDAASGRKLATIGADQRVPEGIAYSRDGTRLFSSERKGQVDVWNAATGALLLSLKGHKGEVFVVAFVSDDLGVVTAGDDGTVRLWDPATGLERQRIRTHEGGPAVIDKRPIGLAVSPDGCRIATVTPSGPARIWDRASGQALLTIGSPAKTKPSGAGIAFDSNGDRLAFAGDNDEVLIVDAADGRTLATLTGHTGEVESIAFAPDGSRIAVSGADRIIRVWDPVRGDELLSLRGHWSEVCGLAWSCDGRYLASVSHDRTVRVWDGGPAEYITIKDRNLVSGMEKGNP
jgi:eukaryotic-like serine/threonine-protein kinase